MSEKSLTQTETFQSRESFLAHCKAQNMAFLKANSRKVIIEYMRDSPPSHGKSMKNAKGKPNAVLVAFKHDDGQISVGCSAVKPNSGDKFVKEEGLWRALRRAIGEGRKKEHVPYRFRDQTQMDEINYSAFIRRATEKLNKERQPQTDKQEQEQA